MPQAAVTTFLPRALAALVATALLVTASASPAEARVYKTRTNIDTTPSAAEVFLVTPQGEEALGLTPLKRVKIPRGTVTLRFKKEGYKDLIETVTIGRRTESFVFNLIRMIKPATIEFIGADEYRGAKIEVDGRPVGVVPGSVETPPGRHHCIVRKDGYGSWERWIDVQEGQRVTFDVVLKKEAAASGTVLVTSYPSGADIILNGTPRGQTPTVLQNVAPGNALVVVSKQGYEQFSQTITVTSGQQTVVDAKLVPAGGGRGTIKVQVDVQDAQIVIDGEVAGTGSLSKEVAAGKHVVTAQAEGYVPATKDVQVRNGEVSVVNLSLADATAQATAVVRVVANVPGAQVIIDGGQPQPAPLTRSDLEPGTHFVRVEAPGHAVFEQTVQLKPGERQEIVADLRPAGKLTVTVVDNQPAEVFLNGESVGRTPLVLEDIQAGTYEVIVKRDDGKTESRMVAVGTAKPVNLEFGFRPQKEPHRSLPWSAKALDEGRGTISLYSGFPWLLGLRFNGGVYENLVVGLDIRSMGDIITEFEGRVLYNFLHMNNFALAGEVGFGGGVGWNERDTGFLHLRFLASLLIAERAAVTVRLGGGYIDDRVLPPGSPRAPMPGVDSNGRQHLWTFRIGLSADIGITEGMNFWLLVEGDPIDVNDRHIFDESFGVDLRVYFQLGLSFLF